MQKKIEAAVVASSFFFHLDAAWLNEGRCPGGAVAASSKTSRVREYVAKLGKAQRTAEETLEMSVFFLSGCCMAK